jgi:hypothetical protein
MPCRIMFYVMLCYVMLFYRMLWYIYIIFIIHLFFFLKRTCHGSGSETSTSHPEGQCSIVGWCMWGLRSTNWHWGRFLSECFISPCQDHSTNSPYLPSSTNCCYQKDKWVKPGNPPPQVMLLRKSWALERSYRKKYFGRRAFFGCSSGTQAKESSSDNS